jgi:hypothetical protein
MAEGPLEAQMSECMAIEMAELIEQGLRLITSRACHGSQVQEKPNAFLERVGAIYYAGPLGLAFIARDGDPQLALDHWMQVSNDSDARGFEAAAQLLGISEALARLVQLNHRNGLTATAIARELRRGSLGMASGGKPALHLQPPRFSPARTAFDKLAG